MLYTLKGGYVYTNKEIKQINVIVDNNEIVEISDSVRGQIIDVTGLYVAPSFIDPHVHMREPGFTDSETIKTGSRAAARGGYTKVFLMPNTNPVISSIEAYNELLNIIKKDSIIDCLPLVAITKDEQGKELVDFEQFDAVGFSDDGKPVKYRLFMGE
jgi:dihydroorotase